MRIWCEHPQHLWTGAGQSGAISQSQASISCEMLQMDQSEGGIICEMLELDQWELRIMCEMSDVTNESTSQLSARCPGIQSLHFQATRVVTILTNTDYILWRPGTCSVWYCVCRAIRALASKQLLMSFWSNLSLEMCQEMMEKSWFQNSAEREDNLASFICDLYMVESL